MKTLAEINAEARNYSNGSEPLHEAFVAGATWMATGKYYKSAELFSEPKSVDIEASGEPVVRLKDGLIPSFEDWWNAYNKKRGRKKAESKWNKLSHADKIACMKATPAYVDSTPDVQYRLDPLTYLNGERWNDEIINRPNYEQQRTISLASKAARILSGANNPG